MSSTFTGFQPALTLLKQKLSENMAIFLMTLVRINSMYSKTTS